MSRRIRLLAIALITTFALGTSACAAVTGPSADCGGAQNSGTC